MLTLRVEHLLHGLRVAVGELLSDEVVAGHPGDELFSLQISASVTVTASGAAFGR